MTYRLALNLGSTFLGWCVLETLDATPVRIADMGVRIFPDGRDGKSKEPLALSRRHERCQRRNRDRRQLRQKRLIKIMMECGLMPAEETGRKALESIDPYEIRARTLNEKVPLHNLGRALFHISQHRGFKSNRKIDKGDDASGNMKQAIKDLHDKLLTTGNRTLGEYLYEQHRTGNRVRVRTRMIGGRAAYSFYPGREMYEQEVDAILEVQKKYHPQLTDNVCNEIRDIIFYQRPLKPSPVGRCRFERDELCARRALPLVQKFRIWQEVSDLDVEDLADGGSALALKDREKIVEALLSSRKRTFGQIRKLLGLEAGCRFNIETHNRRGVRGDNTSDLMSRSACFGARWHELSDDQQEDIITMLFNEADADEVCRILITEWHLSPEQAEEVSLIPISGTEDGDNLSEGYARVSKKAILKIMPYLEQGHKYDEAVKRAGYEHSDLRTNEIFEFLPYYGQVLPDCVRGGSYDDKDKQLPDRYFGKINNPSLHIALNQARILVNALIEVYGPPDEIIVEVARDLKEPADVIYRKQARIRKDNERIDQELKTLKVTQNTRNRMLFRLWEDLAEEPQLRCCPFSGRPIAVSDIFNGDFEEEHILPFSRSYNDGQVNKVLSSREWNRRKGSKSPFEAFGHTEDWPRILARAQNLPDTKRWRFREDAWTKLEGRDGVTARTLHDANYMARLTRAYLSALFDIEEGKRRVSVVPGRLTAFLGDKWQLNDLLGEEAGQTDYTDHRQRSIDASITGCTDRGLLKRLSDAARKLEEDQSLLSKPDELATDLPPPFDGFRDQLEQQLKRIIISYKPDHGGAGKAVRAARPYTVASLHKQTAYGLIQKPDTQTPAFATRMPADSLLRRADIQRIADAAIRQGFLAAVEGLEEGEAEWKQALAKAGAPGGIMTNGIRRVRLHVEKTPDTMVGIVQPSDKGSDDAQPFKFYELRGNYCAEIYCTDKGKKAGQWQCEIISHYHAHQKTYIPNWRKENPTASLIMRLHTDDMLVYEKDGSETIARVKKLTKLENGGAIYLRPHTIAREEFSKLSWAASAAQLRLRTARKISVDIMGRVKGPVRMKKKSEAA